MQSLWYCNLCRSKFVNFSLRKDIFSFYIMLSGVGHVHSKETCIWGIKKLKTVVQFNQVSMRKSNFNHYKTGASFPYFASGIESAWAAWLPLILLESLEYLWYLEDYKRDGVGWFLGARDGGGGIWRRFLICVMLSRVYVIGTRNCLTEINASSTSK